MKRRSVGMAACLMALGVGLVSAPRADAVGLWPGEDKLSFAWKQLAVTCEVNNDQTMMRWVVKARMKVNNRDHIGGWATEMVFKVRVIPGATGINAGARDFTSKSFKTPSYTATYSHDFEAKTGWVSVDLLSWRLETKYLWDRPSPKHNVSRHIKGTRDLKTCGGFTWTP